MADALRVGTPSVYRSFGIVFAILLGLAAGYRLLGEGSDFQQYLYFYDSLRSSSSLEVSRFEPGFVLLAYLAKFGLGADYSFYSALLISVGIFLKFEALSSLRRPLLAILFYIMAWYPLHEYTQIRLGIATSLLFVAFLLYSKGYLIWAILAVAAVGLFHSSGYLLATTFVVALLAQRLSMFVALPVLIGGAMFGSILVQSLLTLLMGFNPLILSYLDNFSRADAPTLLTVPHLVVLCLLASMILLRTINTPTKRALFLCCCASFGLFMTFADSPVFAHRTKELLLVPLTLLVFDDRLTVRTLPQMMLALLFGAMSFYVYWTSGIIGGE